VIEQHRQDLDGLLLKPDAQASLAQFASAEIQLENSKDEPSPGPIVRAHDEVNLRRKRTTRPTGVWQGS
jgi:hypothetical protein